MKSSVIYRSPYACNNAKNVKPSMQHRTEDNNQQVEDEQTIQAEEWNLPETEDCSSSVIARSIENSTDNYTTEDVPKGKRKVKVSDPVSMKKYLFDNYRVAMYTFLNKCRRNGTISNMIGQRVLNGVFDHKVVDLKDITFWRIDRENFWADVSVELKILTRTGSFPWNCIIECLCSFEADDFFITFEDLSTSVDRRGFDLLSPFLVPYFTSQNVDEITQELWLRYEPSALHDSKGRSAVRLAEKMGLKVEYYDIYEHQEVRGIIFFADDELRVGADRFETDDDGRKHRIKTDKPGLVEIPAGTIVINTNKINRDYSEFHIYHECIHNEFHYLFFRLQQMGSNDPRRMKTKEIIVGKNEEVTDEMFFIEKQANRGAYGLMMPAGDTADRIIMESYKVKNARHPGEKFEMIGKRLSTALHLPHFHIRARMIQLGFIEAKGALNYVERKLIRPFAFNIDSWRQSEHTYVVDKGTVYDICRNNEKLKELIDNRDYVYAEGHVVMNEPRFVRKEGNKYVLTDLANGHVDDCCLRFVRQYRQENIGQFVYGRMYYDEDYLKQTLFYLSDVMNRDQIDELDAKKKYKAEFPVEFREAVKMLLKKNNISIERLAEMLAMDRVTLSRWLSEPRRYRNEDFLTILSLILKLPDWLSDLLFRRAHFQLDEDDRRQGAILEILRAMSADGIEAANDFLKTRELAPLTVDGY